jgi:hypothetical protein
VILWPLSSSSGRSLKVATLYRITIIILHYLVRASLNESDIIVALANNSPLQRQSCEDILPRRGPEAPPGHLLLLGD